MSERTQDRQYLSMLAGNMLPGRVNTGQVRRMQRQLLRCWNKRNTRHWGQYSWLEYCRMIREQGDRTGGLTDMIRGR
jgi:hypothetical protein